MSAMEWIIGVDEAGRAPLAGPVSVGAVRVPRDFDFVKELPGLNDSKLLTPAKRDELYEKARELKARGTIHFCVRFSSHDYIDAFGITRAVRRGVWNGVRYLAPEPAEVEVFLDGLLKAPRRYTQHTVIHGDALVPAISLASVLAKVERDRLMKRLAKRYPHWGFELHKGYPTKYHYRMIEEHGLSEVHRKTYCKNAVSVVS